MRGAFGKPQGLVARVNIGQPLMSVRTYDKHKESVIEALRRTKFKFPGCQDRDRRSDCVHMIAAKDHASIQMNICDVDETTGRMTSTFKTYAICGQIRRMGESDDCINRLAKKDGIIAKNF